MELTGSSLFDYIHQADHDELAEQLGVTIANPNGAPAMLKASNANAKKWNAKQF